MTDDVLVRDARPGDGAGLAEVWLDAADTFVAVDPEYFRQPAAEGLAEWYEELIALPRQRRLMLVAECGGAVVGAIGVSLQEPVASAEHQVMRDLTRRVAHVDVLAVAEGRRRTGVGRQLMAAAERWALAEGAEVVLLETHTWNPSSMAFYQRALGFDTRTVSFRKVLPS